MEKDGVLYVNAAEVDPGGRDGGRPLGLSTDR
jgi:hypothetical protein